jgi:Mn2+/Fe2+ NRAMP family transporter
VFILLLVNRRDLMGDQVNSRAFNWVAWISTVAMILLTVILVYTAIAHPESTGLTTGT